MENSRNRLVGDNSHKFYRGINMNNTDKLIGDFEKLHSCSFTPDLSVEAIRRRVISEPSKYIAKWIFSLVEDQRIRKTKIEAKDKEIAELTKQRDELRDVVSQAVSLIDGDSLEDLVYEYNRMVRLSTKEANK